MEYPVLHWNVWGGGLLIALVATIHVFIAHFAVGGGLFIAVMETRTQRLGLHSLRGYLHRYAKFFLILTMVVGAITGVGIWISISIGAPGAASALIHTFVLGWATEWTFFLAEIVTILTYMRSFESQRSTRRLILAWLYFAFAWASLAIVQGFISFMLTPGEWLTTHRFWDGFFNPTYFPGLVLRTAIAGVLAGVFGLLTAQGVADETERKRLSRFCSWWAILPLPVAVAAGWWHIAVLSPEQQALALGRSPEVALGMRVFWWATPIVLAGGALLAGGLPRRWAKIVAGTTLAASFFFIGSFEYMREAARRPYLISGYIYSNGVLVSQAKEINEKGFLSLAKWSRVKTVENENLAQAGRELFYLQCVSCHSLGGPMLDIAPRSAKYTASGMEALLTGLGKVGRYMPPFLGTKQEKKALAHWLTEGLHGPRQAQAPSLPQSEDAVPPFAPQSQYLLTAVADKGINMAADAAGVWTLRSATQGLTAHLLRRGPSPELVSTGVTISYSVEDGPSGTLAPAGRAFRAGNIAVSPYTAREKDGFDPYPVAVVQAKDASGALLAETRAVLPVSSEMGCKNCHGGSWSHQVAGIAKGTATDVLKAHDRLSLTTLARSGSQVECASCHSGQGEGSKRALNLSAAVHGLHAVYLAGRGGEACNMCHPTDPKGATRAFRDPHAAAGFDCTNCHGTMEKHALSLLAREKQQGVPGAAKLAELIAPGAQLPAGRAPWINQPQCVTCHVNYGAPQNDQAFGAWNAGAQDLFKAKRDELDAMTCASCHGPAHAVYPASNPYAKNRDNLAPLQYQGKARALGGAKNCKACHTVDMDAPAHHPGMGVE